MKKSSPGFKQILLNGIIVGEVSETGSFEHDAQLASKLLKDKGLLEEISAAKAIFNQAQSFASTAAQLYKNDLCKEPRNGLSIAPFVVNCTFSIELYLKALAKKHGHTSRGHKLIELYNDLPEQALENIKAAIVTYKSQTSASFNTDIKIHLENLNNAFVEWRYIYEHKKSSSIKFEDIIYVANVLFKAFRDPENT